MYYVPILLLAYLTSFIIVLYTQFDTVQKKFSTNFKTKNWKKYWLAFLFVQNGKKEISSIAVEKNFSSLMTA